MVISDVNQITYNGNGSQTAWPFTFEFIDVDDIKLQLIDADGARHDITSDYYVDKANKTVYYPGYAPGAEPPEEDQPPKVQTGQKLRVYRKLPVNQLANLGDKWPFTVIEKGLDKLTMLIQDVWGWISSNIMQLSDSEFKWDAKGYAIENVGGPVNAKDAATKSYVDGIIAGIIAQGGNITFCDNIAILKETDFQQGVFAAVAGYYEINDGGGGVYSIRAAMPSDVDDGRNIIFIDNGNVAELLTDGIETANGFDVAKINGPEANSMFPDVVKYNNVYYLVFRSGTLHGSYDGTIALSKSTDGLHWSEPVIILDFDEANVDARDPFLSVVNDTLMLSCFSRTLNPDDSITYNGYVYALDPETNTLSLVRNIADEINFNKILVVNGEVIFATYNSVGSYIYKGASIAAATKIMTFNVGYEPVLRYYDNKYLLLKRENYGSGSIVKLSASTDLTNWTDIPVDQMIAASSLTKIGKYYYIGFRDSIIGIHEFGEFSIKVLDENFNTVNTFKVFSSQTQDCGYSSIYHDTEMGNVIIASYYQDGTSKTSVYVVNCSSAKSLIVKNVFPNKFELNNCQKPAYLTDNRGYAAVLEMAQFSEDGYFLRGRDNNGDIKYILRVDKVTGRILMHNPNGGMQFVCPQNCYFVINGTTVLELNSNASITIRGNVETRGTHNAYNLKVKLLNDASAPYVDVVRFAAGAFADIPDIVSTPTGFIYYDSTNARFLINQAGTWKSIELNSI